MTVLEAQAGDIIASACTNIRKNNGTYLRVVWFLLVMLLDITAAPAQGMPKYVSPSGSGAACTMQRPCSLDTGLFQAQPADEVVLLNGTYHIIRTVLINKNGVTLRALNKHQASIVAASGYYLLIVVYVFQIQSIQVVERMISNHLSYNLVYVYQFFHLLEVKDLFY